MMHTSASGGGRSTAFNAIPQYQCLQDRAAYEQEVTFTHFLSSKTTFLQETYGMILPCSYRYARSGFFLQP